MPSYHSRFGGMWIDRSDFDAAIHERVRTGKVPGHLENPIRRFERDGFVILENAAPESALEAFDAAIFRAFRDGHPHLLAQLPGDPTPRSVSANMERKGIRVVDAFAVLTEALGLFSSPRLIEFMQALFEEHPLLFQSLSFDMGSEQGLHQDTAYVVTNRPLELVACWIALEDVRPGSGELQYMVGSHRLPDFVFGGDRKHWDSARDGLEIHSSWSQWILDEGARRNLPVQKFLAKRGDILVWHADLAHGGSPITNTDLTRRSLVGHFCPESATPHFMSYTPERQTKMRYGPLRYCSAYYDLQALAKRSSREKFLGRLFG